MSKTTGDELKSITDVNGQRYALEGIGQNGIVCYSCKVNKYDPSVKFKFSAK